MFCHTLSLASPLMNNDSPGRHENKKDSRKSDSTLRSACVSKSNMSLKDDEKVGGMVSGGKLKYPQASTIIQSI